MSDLHPQSWPALDIYVKRGWAAFGWYALKFPHYVYVVVAALMGTVGLLSLAAALRERVATRRLAIELAVLVMAVVGVVLAVEATYFTSAGGRPVVAEQGRYAFVAIAALATIAVGSCLAFGRRLFAPAVAVMVTCVIGFHFASQLLAIARFYT